MTTGNLRLLQAMVTDMKWMDKRQSVLADNIANADTPGYRAKDLKPLDFKDLLGSTSSALSLQTAHVSLAETNPEHMGLGGATNNDPKQQKDKNPYEVAPSGNAVVLEEQLMKASQNYTNHAFITSLYQKNINMLNMAVKSN